MLVNKVVEDAGGATSMPMSVRNALCSENVISISCLFFIQMNLEPGQEVFEVMIAANKVGLVIGMCVVCQRSVTLVCSSFRIPCWLR